MKGQSLTAVLRQVSAAYYVMAGVYFVYALLGVTQLATAKAALDGGIPEDVPALLGYWLIALAILFNGLAYTIALGLAGHWLQSRHHYGACLAIAALSCLFYPFGTVLGGITIYFLLQSKIRQSFDAPPLSTTKYEL